VVLTAGTEADHSMADVARVLSDEAIDVLLLGITVGMPVDEDDRRLHPGPLIQEVSQRTPIEDRSLTGVRQATALPFEQI
jgi:hypothetical protein